MNKFIVILMTIGLFVVINLGVMAEPTHLTDRELLIQLTSKVEFIERTVRRIEEYTEDVKFNVNVVEKQVARNEINIASFFSRIEDLNTRWTGLLVLFGGFIIGIFVWMWRRAYNGNERAKLVKEHK